MSWQYLVSMQCRFAQRKIVLSIKSWFQMAQLSFAGLQGGALVSAGHWTMNSSAAFSMHGCSSPGYLIEVPEALILAFASSVEFSDRFWLK